MESEMTDLNLVVDNDAAPVAVIERWGSVKVVTVEGGISRSAFQNRCAAPLSGLSWERRDGEAVNAFHGRTLQLARARGVTLLIYGGYPNCPHLLECQLSDRAEGMKDGERMTIPLDGGE